MEIFGRTVMGAESVREWVEKSWPTQPIKGGCAVLPANSEVALQISPFLVGASGISHRLGMARAKLCLTLLAALAALATLPASNVDRRLARAALSWP